MSRLVETIKKSEGFVGNNYEDSLGIPTIGYGTKLPLTKAEAETILAIRLNQKISHLLEEKPIVLRLPQDKQEVLFEAAYQLGVGGLLRFKMMWLALENFDYKVAAQEMKLSRWYMQTPERVERLAKQMES